MRGRLCNPCHSLGISEAVHTIFTVSHHLPGVESSKMQLHLDPAYFDSPSPGYHTVATSIASFVSSPSPYISASLLQASSLLELLSFSARLRHCYPVRLAPTDSFCGLEFVPSQTGLSSGVDPLNNEESPDYTLAP